MNFPEYVSFTLDRLESLGYSAYLVGGCVRDHIMGNTPNDYDITTNATPEQIEECFSDVRTIDVGKKHGTITLVLNDSVVEVTTYRIDGEYKDSRHPESVTFTDRIEDDLSRRDFTVNAIAYSPQRGFVDPFGGRKDIESGIIRCVGIPERRFGEDALRILRALRFASRLGFCIEDSTSTAIHEKRELLLNIAMERIKAEFEGMISCCNFPEIYREYFDVFKTFIPTILKIDNNVLIRASDISSNVVLCSLFSCYSDLLFLSDELKRLKFENATSKNILTILSCVRKYCDKCSDADIKKSVAEIGKACTRDMYYVLYCLSGDVKYMDAVKRFNELDKNEEWITLKKLNVKGNEIIEALKINPSDTGGILSCLLNDVIEGVTVNKKDALLKHAKKYI